jgi:hypothetical protein
LQALEEEKQKLQDKVICHEEFHKGIFHELERNMKIRKHALEPSTSIHEYWQAENVKPTMQKGLPLSKGMIKKYDSSYFPLPVNMDNARG